MKFRCFLIHQKENKRFYRALFLSHSYQEKEGKRRTTTMAMTTTATRMTGSFPFIQDWWIKDLLRESTPRK